MERSGLSRVTVRAAVGILERQGWLVRRQGLGTFVANPVKQELASGVRTITEVLSHHVGEAPQRIAETLGVSKVLCINRRFRAMGAGPWP
jgi:GntR family transcriptional regulator